MTNTHPTRHFSLLGLLLGLLIGLPILIALLLIQLHPIVPENPTLDNLAINTIEQLIVDNAPASIAAPGEISLHLDADELNLLAAFLLQNVPGIQDVNADVALASGHAILSLSAPIPSTFQRLFLNVRAGVRGGVDGVDLFAVRLGYLPVPDALLHFILRQLAARLSNTYVNYQELMELQQSLRSISFQEDLLEISLDWDPRLLTQVQTQAEQLFLNLEDKERIVYYLGEIARITQAQAEDTRTISLSLLLAPLFEEAQQRGLQGADPVTENRTLLQALSLYVNEADLASLLSSDTGTSLNTPRRLSVTLQRRPDLAQHFTSSAAMSATVGTNVAGLLSTSKEAHDARYRTGFSFSDLTANSAGAALGNAATENTGLARQMQLSIASTRQESDYMPPVSRDNAGLSEVDFSAQYTDRNSEAYRARLTMIEEEIAALPVYQQP